MDAATTSRKFRNNQSFSSSLLDEIYRSIDTQQSNNDCFQNNHDERRAPLFKKCNPNYKKPAIGRKSAADIDTGFYSSEYDSMYGFMFKPKPVRTNVYQNDEFINKREKNDSKSEGKHEGKFTKTKSKALKIYSDLKKVKQPISPGGRLSSFLNSLFANGNAKKRNNSSAIASSAVGYTDDLDRKSKSANASTSSSTSSFSRSCLSNTPSSRGKLSKDVKRSVRFYPVSVIVDEDCQPCGHKSLQEEKTMKFSRNSMRKDVIKRDLSEKDRRISEATKKLLKDYHKKVEFDSIRNNEDEDESDSSSDLFELESLTTIGMNKYREELPIYETTRLDTN
ncbi:protein BIG GRAIN 1-like B [Rutidosis leptorrhynchoides]|uniref:protein BIG GRAIN 1-like B n=1 Tax=Rutidosis leptorrhynchoides TaxID=125765 RepID=UPI003A99CE2D